MGTFVWPAEDGWPYPDVESELVDLAADLDVDLLSLKTGPPHLFDDLDERERRVVVSHYGLDGEPPRSMKQLHTDLGLSRAELRETLGSALHKLRVKLSS